MSHSLIATRAPLYLVDDTAFSCGFRGRLVLHGLLISRVRVRPLALLVSLLLLQPPVRPLHGSEAFGMGARHGENSVMYWSKKIH